MQISVIALSASSTDASRLRDVIFATVTLLINLDRSLIKPFNIINNNYKTKILEIFNIELN